jgi:type I restriction enzyme, S subunit
VSDRPSRQASGLAWAPDVPAHWTVKKLAFLASLQSGDSITADDIKDDGPYPVYGGNGLRGYTDRFTHDGEYVLIGRQGALCGNINYAKGEFWASEHAVVVAPREEIAVRWLGELLRAMELNQYSVSAAQPGLSVETIAALKVPIPPLKEQRAIADYLDRETARLDALVVAKERVLGLLAEKRRALITHAVTRGLDDSAPLKDTGVEWLPQVPRHWTSTKISRLFRQEKRLGFPDLTILSVYREYGVIERASRDDNANRVPDDLEKYQLVEVDDLVINKMKAWQGSLGIAALRGITSPDYVVFRPLHREDPRFLHSLLRNHRLTTVYLSMSNGIRTSQWRLEPDRFGDLAVFLPPLLEQRAIVAHIAAESAKLDAVRFATERTITLLTERRASLIAAAVTGQIEVA